jgi:hypothetical protein
MGDQEVESSIENDDEHIDAMLKRLIEVHGPPPEKTHRPRPLRGHGPGAHAHRFAEIVHGVKPWTARATSLRGLRRLHRECRRRSHSSSRNWRFSSARHPELPKFFELRRERINDGYREAAE